MQSHQGPVMVVHDKFDKMVPIERIEDIKRFTEKPEFLITEGLGHNRILKDESVINKIKDFIDSYKFEQSSFEYAIKFGMA